VASSTRPPSPYPPTDSRPCHTPNAGDAIPIPLSWLLVNWFMASSSRQAGISPSNTLDRQFRLSGWTSASHFTLWIS
jgi:hypothetical protein